MPGTPRNPTCRSASLTPHSSALGADRHSRAASIFLDNLTRYVAAEPLVNVVTDTELIG